MGKYFIDSEYEEVNFLGYAVTMPSAERINYYRDKMNAIIKEYNFLDDCLQEQADKCKAEGSGGGHGFNLIFGWDLSVKETVIL